MLYRYGVNIFLNFNADNFADAMQVPFYWHFLIYVEAMFVFGLSIIPTVFVNRSGNAYVTLGIFCILHVLLALLNMGIAYVKKVDFFVLINLFHFAFVVTLNLTDMQTVFVL